MGVGAPQDRRVQDAVRTDIVDIRAGPCDQGEILAPPNGLADESSRQRCAPFTSVSLRNHVGVSMASDRIDDRRLRLQEGFQSLQA